MKKSKFEKKIKEQFGLNKSAFNNKIKNANRKMNAFLKKHDVYTNIGVKYHEKVYHLRRLLGVEPYEIPKKQCRLWLIECWENETNDIIKKTPVGFYLDKPWLELRRRVLDHYGRKCMKCGNENYIAVDHIKPRSLYPELELVFENQQVLCRECNSSKSNKNSIDYRNLNSLKGRMTMTMQEFRNDQYNSKKNIHESN